MVKTRAHKVADLHLDLDNFRTVHQQDEDHAVNALMAIKPERFWGLMESLLDDGYEPTETIIIIKDGKKLVVKEGNRRIASLKIILGMIKGIDIPDDLQKKINGLTSKWEESNQSVPCAVYPLKDKAVVDRLVSRTHAKGEAAARYRWPAIATARYARDQNGHPEPGLDLLEKYLEQGKNLQPLQAERWSGDYPITVLDEAVQKLAPLLGYVSSADLAKKYPDKHRKAIEEILLDIGISNLGFRDLRDVLAFWGARYGVAQPVPVSTPTPHPAGGQSGPSGSSGGGGTSSTGTGSTGKSASPKTLSANDPKSVRRKLRAFTVRGKGRDKIATLIDEIKTLKHEDHPHAFCFLLRSIFELSAKAYCVDHKAAGGPVSKKSDGSDKSLVDLLREITAHMTNQGKDRAKKQLLHGALNELGRPSGILSVTSMNQLVHSPSFSIAPPDISVLFGNIFPLLEELNG